MRALTRKLFRDLWHLKGQSAAIAMIIASGVALFVAQLAVLESLKLTRDDYYARERFADVFANCKRAPLSTAERIAEIPSVSIVQTRVAAGVMLEVPGLEEPATARLVSLPEGAPPALCDLHLVEGRLPEPGAQGEVAVIDMFARASKYRTGDTVVALLNGRRQELRMVGFVLSPEYVYSIPADAIVPDDRRHAVMWMNERELAAAFDMEGAFNDVTLKLARGAIERDVIARLDAVLEPYGGLGAYARKDQVSNWFLNNEFEQLETFGVMIPIIFLGVAAFLLNVVLARLIATQREQIAALKAFGYSNLAVAMHYAQLVALIVALGAAVGIATGAWLGGMLIQIYREYYHFPTLDFHLSFSVPISAIAVTATAAAIGTVGAVRRAAKLPPAEAMRPEAPPLYRATLVERLGLQRLMSQPSRMIMRSIERRPLKAALSVLGMSMAVAILVMGMAFMDIMFHVIEVQNNVIHREDLTVSFIEPRGRNALHELRALPGVTHAEPTRSVPAKLVFGHRQRRAGIQGIEAGAHLDRLVNTEIRPIAIPPEGILLSRVLGEALGARVGDEVTVEVLEGARPVRSVRVSALVDDFMGVSAYMDLDALNRLMREDGVITGARLLVDAQHTADIYRRLRARPAIASVSSKQAAIDNLRRMIEENLMVSVTVNILFAMIISFGIVYNNARISLSERGRELASLRVLGLTRAEISYILLGELAVLVLAALPLGFIAGRAATAAILVALNSEVMRFPLVVNGSTYALAALVVIVAAVISGLLVRRRLDRLDLVEVLKTRE